MMETIARAMTQYLVDKAIIKKEANVIYEYGFISLLETVFSIIICVSLSLCMNKFFECIFFFLIFIPLRSYAGGLHFEKYSWCLLCSCLTLILVLFSIEQIVAPIHYSMLGSYASLLLIKLIYPVENINREVDKAEENFFRKKINYILGIDFIIINILFFAKYEKILFLMMLTLVLITTTMVLGKVKYIIQCK